MTEVLGISKIRLVADRHLQFTVPPEAGHRLSAFLTFMKVREHNCTQNKQLATAAYQAHPSPNCICNQALLVSDPHTASKLGQRSSSTCYACCSQLLWVRISAFGLSNFLQHLEQLGNEEPSCELSSGVPFRLAANAFDPTHLKISNSILPAQSFSCKGQVVCQQRLLTRAGHDADGHMVCRSTKRSCRLQILSCSWPHWKMCS